MLGSLPDADWARMAADFRHVDLSYRQVLVDTGEPMHNVHFPTSGIVSCVTVFEDGSVAEMGSVGSEGLVEVSAILASRSALGRYVVQISGGAYTTTFESFTKWMRTNETFRTILFDYAQAYLVQILRTVACNAVHSVEERTARWLLSCHDRSKRSTFTLTQDFLAEMLGVGRPTVNVVARTLQRAGMIRYSRGVVVITDPVALEEASCECYGIIRNAYQQRRHTRPTACTTA